MNNIRCQALDGLRGWAALSVVIYHAILAPMVFNRNVGEFLHQDIYSFDFKDLITRCVVAFFNGELAVIYFFILSGALLVRSLEIDSKRNGFFSSCLFFLPKRFFRIYPALFFTIALMFFSLAAMNLLAPEIFKHQDFESALKNIALIQTSYHGASWTLKAEVLAAPFILLYFMIKGKGKISLLTSSVLFAYSLYIFQYPTPEQTMSLFNLWFVYFCAGFLCWELTKTKFIKLIAKSYVIIILIISTMLVRQLTSMNSYNMLYIQVVLCCLVVSALFVTDSGSLFRFLTSRLSIFLGEISYSLYLINVLFMNLFMDVMNYFNFNTHNYLTYGAILFVLTIIPSIPLSIWMEKNIEIKYNNIAKRVFSFKKRLPADEAVIP